MKFKKGDEIEITIGKDKGKRGKIERVLPKEHKVLVLGQNLYKRHLKKKDEKNPGGIIDFPRALSTAKVALICPKCKKPTRIGFLVTDKEKQRICRKCKGLI
jgi:large subunit ribosomal protein L24